MLKSVNPFNGQTVGQYEEHRLEDVQQLLDQAHRQFLMGRQDPLMDRKKRMLNLANRLRAQSDVLAGLITAEMGKPIRESQAEIEKCAVVCEFYADQTEGFLKPDSIKTEASNSYVRYEPLGIVLAVMPWNFPFWQVFRFLAPSLMAGNVGLLKHASNVTGCAVAIEQLVKESEFPNGSFTTLKIPASVVADIVAHPLVTAVTLTGSDHAGRAVAKVAGQHLKKCVLELGGSDPFIVLADADIEKAARQATVARTLNSGQSCIAAKRFLVEESVAEEFTRRFVHHMTSLQVGDPMDHQTDIGPLARPDLKDELHDQVQRSLAYGAKALCGAGFPASDGNFYPPTILTNVAPGCPAFQEELFGPVAAVTVVKTAAEAVLRANQSDFGLGASIWTNDTARGERLAAELESGGVFINQFTKSDPRLPFGGIKSSGFGRELSDIGMKEFLNAKTVWVE